MGRAARLRHVRSPDLQGGALARRRPAGGGQAQLDGRRIPDVASRGVKVGVLASGAGTNLQALLDTVHGREADVVAVASDKPGAQALERAASAGVETRVFERGGFADRAARDTAIADWLDLRGVELVVLAGYTALLDAGFIAPFPGPVLKIPPRPFPA